jgi:GT2 family glycosyltransferase
MSFRDLEVILVDNGSKDGSQQLAKMEFPGLTVVQLDSNLGYGKAINAGIMVSRGKYVGLVDNDVEVSVDWLSRLLLVIEQDPSVGIAGSKVYFASSDRIIYSAGEMLNPKTGIVETLGYRTRDVGQFDILRAVDGVDGCCMLVRRDLLEKVGYLDEGYGFYWEDTDLSRKAQALGYHILYVPSSVATHRISMTSSRLGLKSYYLRRGWIRFLIIHSKNKDLLPRITIAALLAFEWSIIDTLHGRRDSLGQTIRALLWNVTSLRETLSARSRLQQLDAVN